MRALVLGSKKLALAKPVLPTVKLSVLRNLHELSVANY